MRRLFALILALLICCSFFGCGGEAYTDETGAATEDTTTESAELNVPVEQESVYESAHTHVFEADNCLAARVCACGETAEPWGHNYMGGTCSVCGEPDPDYTGVPMVWVPTRGGTKYHTFAFCSGMEESMQITQEEANEQGYEACKRCH